MPLELTTTFTPPTACLNELWAASTNDGKVMQTWMNIGPTNPAECLPSGWAPTTYFSPGLCPEGYAIAKSTTRSVGTEIETAATCCPIGQGNTYSTRPPATGPVDAWASLLQITELCQWSPEPHMETVYNYTLSTEATTTTLSGTLPATGWINAYGLEVRWQSTDFTSKPTTAEATLNEPNTQSHITHHTHQTKASHSLSMGAKIGIGVGCAIASVLIIALMVGAWFIRRKQQELNGHIEMDSVEPKPNIVHRGLSELPVGKLDGRAEADGFSKASSTPYTYPTELEGQIPAPK